MSTEIKQGMTVFSVRGRDKGTWYVCVQVVDETFVLVSDGKIHKLNKPKKKNIKHLKTDGTVLENIEAKLVQKKKIFDSELNSSLRGLIDTEH